MNFEATMGTRRGESIRRRAAARLPYPSSYLFISLLCLVSWCRDASAASNVAASKQPQQQPRGHHHHPPPPPADRLLEREKEYEALYSSTIDKSGLASIRELHMQLDDDKDGSIEPSETGDFIRADLKYGSDHTANRAASKFHRKDSEITVNDLWHTWRKGEVHNWTVSQTIDWLTLNVELPQYADNFKRHGVNGSRLPQVAVSSSYLGKVVGIDNPIHRSKITLKAMDVVLFGPPKDSSNHVKDAVLTSLLVLALTLLFYAYRQNSKSKQHLQKMMVDMDGLAKAEKELQELQSKLQQRDSQLELSLSAIGNASGGGGDDDEEQSEEVSRLREEVEILRNELQRAEVELEDKCWMAPPVLQHWLQLTYELESSAYNSKKKAAEEQLELAKDMCEKLNKKRSSFVGAFVSTHGRSIDDVDKSILEAKTALHEVTKDLTERSQRWRQIEMLCGCTIVNNPGIAVLTNLVRHVGTGRPQPQAAAAVAAAGAAVGEAVRRAALSSRMSNRGSQDDLLLMDEGDTHSIAASTSTHMTSVSQSGVGGGHGVGAARTLMSSAASVAGMPTTRMTAVHKAAVAAQMSRESSKESSSADELLPELKASNNAGSGSPALYRSSVKGAQAVGPRIGPGGRKMVKSFSQDAATTSSMVKNAAVAMSNLRAEGTAAAAGAAGVIVSSASDSQLAPLASMTSPATSSIVTTPSVEDNSELLHISSSDAAIASSRRETGSSAAATAAKHSPLTKAKPLAAGASDLTLADGGGGGLTISSATAAVVTSVSGVNQQQQEGGAAGGGGDNLSCCSDTASISSSTTDLTTGEKKKKRRSFFNFRRSEREQKKEVIL